MNQIIYNDFESGFGNWTVAGSDNFLYTDGTYAYEGNNAIELQDNNDNTVASTGNLAFSSYTYVKVDFA